ncbi:MAG: hypothetical protein GXP35_10245 [Actinobacteria bacterium]|nr:hypothetical protein [Actinomycetota bacterium]
MKLFRATVVVVATLLLLGGCGLGERSPSSGDAGSDLPLVELTGDDAMLMAAVERTNELESFRFAMLFEMSVPDEDAIRIMVDGAVDVASGNATLTVDLGSMFDTIPESERSEFESTFGDGSIEIIQAGSSTYMKFPMLAELAGGSGDWVEVPTDASSDVLGLTGISFESPEDLLSGLTDGAVVTEVGSEIINGVATTKFRLDAVEPAASGGDIFGDGGADAIFGNSGATFVWIDDHGVVRRMEVSFNFFGIEGGIAIEFSDFGSPVVVEVPANAVAIDPAQFDLFG